MSMSMMARLVSINKIKWVRRDTVTWYDYARLPSKYHVQRIQVEMLGLSLLGDDPKNIFSIEIPLTGSETVYTLKSVIKEKTKPEFDDIDTNLISREQWVV
jgi:hypothetical protein